MSSQAASSTRGVLLESSAPTIQGRNSSVESRTTDEVDKQSLEVPCRCKRKKFKDQTPSPEQPARSRRISRADSGYEETYFDASEQFLEDRRISKDSLTDLEERGRSRTGRATNGVGSRSADVEKAGSVSASNGSRTPGEDGTTYVSGLRLFLIMTALCMSVFLMALDSAIIAVAIPKISDEFNSLSDIGWYGSAYLLTISALQLFFGKLYTLYKTKWVFFTAIGLFELGSLLCGAARSSLVLILGRAVAGIGSAGLFSGSLIILAHTVPMSSRPLYTGILGSMYGVAVVAGPLLGGVLTDKLSWRWCFYINLPLGALAVGAIALWFHEPAQSAEEARQRRQVAWRIRLKQFDPVGTAVFVPAIVCLLLALEWAGTKYPWRDPRIMLLLVLSGVLATVWGLAQWWQGDLATVPPRIIKKRTIWAASWFAFASGAAFVSCMYFLPIWFQAVQGVSAVESGVRMLPFLLGLVVASVVAGCVVTIWGYYAPFLILSTVCMAVGFGLLSTWAPRTRTAVWLGFQVVAGAGVGFGSQQPVIAVQAVLGIDDVPMGTAVIVFLQTLGGAIFVSIAQTIFTNRLISYLSTVFPGLDPKLVFSAGATDLRGVLPAQVISRVVRGYSDALTRTFLMSAIVAAASVVGSLAIEWRSVKGIKVAIA